MNNEHGWEGRRGGGEEVCWRETAHPQHVAQLGSLGGVGNLVCLQGTHSSLPPQPPQGILSLALVNHGRGDDFVIVVQGRFRGEVQQWVQLHSIEAREVNWGNTHMQGVCVGAGVGGCGWVWEGGGNAGDQGGHMETRTTTDGGWVPGGPHMRKGTGRHNFTAALPRATHPWTGQTQAGSSRPPIFELARGTVRTCKQSER
jgi:hypothetical protein